MFDEQRVPDGLPFLLDDDFTVGNCARINIYLSEAARQHAIEILTLRNDVVRRLRRLLHFVRAERGSNVCLTETTVDDLTAFKELRRQTISEASWSNEASILRGFFVFAEHAKWVQRDPFPTWGIQQKNTLVTHYADDRTPRSLTEEQLRAFLEIGLRADDDPEPPGNAERDYLFGLLLSATGLRRQEGAFLLNCEVPGAAVVGLDQIATITRIGKGNRPRAVLLAGELLRQVDLYRRVEREQAMRASQRRLSRLLAEETLVMVDEVRPGRDPLIVIHGTPRPASLIKNQLRSRLVARRDDGYLDPMTLFVSRFGGPPMMRRWNQVFSDANRRLAQYAPDKRPRLLAETTPHTMRHTFAVRMLAGLMALGRQQADDPYHLLKSPVLAVQQLLGHASPETTYRYLQVADGYDSHVPAVLVALTASLVVGE
jgi:integrase